MADYGAIGQANILIATDGPAQSNLQQANILIATDFVQSVAVPDISGAPEVLATFDGSDSANPAFYHWTFTSIPETSSITTVAAPVPFPDSGASTPIDMTDNELLCHFEGDADDDSGNAFNGTVSGATQVTGHVGSYAYEFDGVNDQINYGDVEALSPGASNWSVACWFQWDGSAGDNNIYAKDDLWEARVLDGYVNYAWQPHWAWDGGTTFSVTADTWYHLVIVYNGSTQKMYKNGSEVYSRDQTGSIGTGSQPFYIGRRTHVGGSFFGGVIDEFAIWSRAISAAEITAIYSLQSGTFAGTSSTLSFTPDVAGTYTVQLEVASGVSTTADAVIATPSSDGRQSRRVGQARGRGFSVTEVNSSLSAGFNSAFD